MRTFTATVPARGYTVTVPSRSVTVTVPARGFTATVPTEGYAIAISGRSVIVTVPARDFISTVPKRDFVFLNTANRRTEYDPDYWVRWGQQNVWPFLPDASHAGMTLEEVEERAEAYP